MDLFKSFFGFITGKAPEKPEESSDNLRNHYMNTESDTNAPDYTEQAVASYNEKDLFPGFINIFFGDNAPDNRTVIRENEESDWSFNSGFFMNPFAIEKEFGRIMNEMEKQFAGMSFQNLHSFIFQDGQYDNFGVNNYESNTSNNEESLRDLYLRNPDIEASPQIRKDIALDGQVSVDDIEKLIMKKDQFPSNPNQIMPQMKFSHESVSVRIGPDGMAEITKITRSEDGTENRTVSKIKIK